MPKVIFSTTIGLLLTLTANWARANEDVKLEVKPDRVEIGLFYGGRKIYVRANTSAAYDVVIKISGADQDLELKKKGKKGGVIWMNIGELSYKAVPSLFIIKSSRQLTRLSSKEVIERLGIGYEALAAKVNASANEDAGSLFGELIKLKEREKLFSVDENGIEVRELGSTSKEASATFFLPPKAPPGEYQVEIYGFKDGKGALLGSKKIRLAFSPTTAFISEMAIKHGLLYGCLASAIAIIAGLLTGYIFVGKGEIH